MSSQGWPCLQGSHSQANRTLAPTATSLGSHNLEPPTKCLSFSPQDHHLTIRSAPLSQTMQAGWSYPECPTLFPLFHRSLIWLALPGLQCLPVSPVSLYDPLGLLLPRVSPHCPFMTLISTSALLTHHLKENSEYL